MIYQDKKSEIESQTSLAEYLASFWNPKAVEKIQEARNSKKQHKFKDDQEFEEHILSGRYKENPLLDAVRKIKSLDQDEIIQASLKDKYKKKSKLPTDLSSIHSTLEKFN